VVAHEELEPHVELLGSESEATGIGGVGGNKGGVAAALSLHGTTNVAFICAHLAAHQVTKNPTAHKGNITSRRCAVVRSVFV